VFAASRNYPEYSLLKIRLATPTGAKLAMLCELCKSCIDNTVSPIDGMELVRWLTLRTPEAVVSPLRHPVKNATDDAPMGARNSGPVFPQATLVADPFLRPRPIGPGATSMADSEL